MYLVGHDNDRKLVRINDNDPIDTYKTILKDPENVINVHDGAIVKYTAYYYKEGLKTSFIGRVVSCRMTDDIITGIYINPLYILHRNEWCKLANYEIISYRSSFLYPHLLMLHAYCRIYAAHVALDYLDTVENITIHDYTISERIIEIY